MPPAPSIPCIAGIRSVEGSTFFREYFFTSPKTGKTIALREVWKGELPEGVWYRMVRARDAGESVVKFTAEELRAIAELAEHAAKVDNKGVRFRRSGGGNWVKRRR